jgi:hypothetical protein
MKTFNPLLDRAAKRDKDKGYQGRKAELSLATRIGGVSQIGSGALEGAKGDVKVSRASIKLLMENKSSTTASFSVKREQLFKIYQEALETNRTPALSFQFVDSMGKSEKRERWVCIPESAFLELISEE